MKIKIEISMEKVAMTVPQLLVLSTIRPNEIPFVDVKKQLDLTDGNLFSHARRLEDYGFITKHKKFKDQFPLTSYRITKLGEKYLSFIQLRIATTPIFTESQRRRNE